MRVKRVGQIIAGSVVAWYGISLVARYVVFVPASNAPALAELECCRLRELAQQRLSAEQMSAVLPSLELVGWHGNTYVSKLIVGPSGQWEVVSEPRWPELWRCPLWKRLLLLDFRKYHYPTWRIRSGDPEVQEVNRSPG